MIIIKKQINVVDCFDAPLGPTYIKRAQQLVKNDRAEWICEDTIRMKLQYVEETIMTTEHKTIAATTATITDQNPAANQIEATMDDEAILELAKRRIAIKRNLFYQLFDYALILICLALLTVIWDDYERFLVALFFSFVWGARLLYRILKFARPSFREGIGAYLKKRNDYKLESEFNRLKKDYLNSNIGHN